MPASALRVETFAFADAYFFEDALVEFHALAETG